MGGFKIRDNRDKNWLWLDNEYLNGYAKHLGTSCTVVYLSLCRFANNESQSCFPSMELIAEQNGINKRTVIRAVKKLEEWKIIEVVRDRKEDGTQANNIYTLLSKDLWKKKPSDIKSPSEDRVTINTQPSDNNNISRVTPVHHNYTNNNYTNINNSEAVASQEIAQLIKLFEPLNPNCKTMYGNKTQRSACAFLIKEFGFKRVSQVIEKVLPSVQDWEYFPTISTPVQLKQKWASLDVALKRASTKKKKDFVFISN